MPRRRSGGRTTGSPSSAGRRRWGRALPVAMGRHREAAARLDEARRTRRAPGRVLADAALLAQAGEASRSPHIDGRLDVAH